MKVLKLSTDIDYIGKVLCFIMQNKIYIGWNDFRREKEAAVELIGHRGKKTRPERN